MRRLIAAMWLFALLPAAWSDDYQPRNSQRAGEEPPSPVEVLYQMTLPEGFETTLFAHEPAVRQPIAMTLDDRGRLWVVESYSYEEWQGRGEDRIIILEDTNGDGRHDKRTLFYDQGKHFAGIALGFGGVWVADAPNVIFIPDRDGNDVPEGPPEVVLDGWSTEAEHNMVNGLTWGPDGWLYGRHGVLQWSKVGVPGTPEEERSDVNCGIWRYHPQLKRFENVVRGTTNPWGMDWDEHGEMFMSGNVNGHLWHVVPGAFLERMHPTTRTPFVYERLTMSADQPHYAGSANWKREWNRGTIGRDAESPLGGGHSHCGAMIYLGDQWPDKYRGVMFMANTHGRRVNMDRLTRRGGSYVGKYEGDFMRANQSWFRGVSLLYGPDGAVYLSDWTDDGECHDHDGVHRTSGRIYKITYGQGKTWQGDLAKETDEALLNHHRHKNAWFERQSRRVLHERAISGRLDGETIPTLQQWLTGDADAQVRLRALWTLHAIGGLDEANLLITSQDESEHIRAWTVRLSEPSIPRLVEMGIHEGSSLVRLHLASAAQRLEVGNRGSLLALLASRQEDHQDTVIQHMLWYALEPTLASAPAALLDWDWSPSPCLQGLIARRLMEPDLLAWRPVVKMLDGAHAPAVLEGVAISLGKQPGATLDPEWERALDGALVKILKEFPEKGLALAVTLNHAPTIRRLLYAASKGRQTADELRTLVQIHHPEVDALCLKLLKEGPAELRTIVLPSLPGRRLEGWQGWLFTHWSTLTDIEKPLALDALIARLDTAKEVGQALAQGRLVRNDISASQAQKMAAMKDEALNALIETHWGSVQQSSQAKRDGIERYRALIAITTREQNLNLGKAIFTSTCATCHHLFGEGGKLGPDLTGSDRGSLDYLLNNIVDPSASVASDYRLSVATGKDDRVIAGSIVEKNKLELVLRTLAGEERMAMDDLRNLTTLKTSLMPEGLLESLTDDQVADLIGYLRTQVAAP